MSTKQDRRAKRKARARTEAAKSFWWFRSRIGHLVTACENQQILIEQLQLKLQAAEHVVDDYGSVVKPGGTNEK